MKIWLVTVGEPLPIETGRPRLLRTGILANLLADRGNEVTWWTSAFDHVHKRFHRAADSTVELKPGLRLVLLRGCGYSSNVHISRLVDHLQIATKFRRRMPLEARPDVILSSFPTIELCVQAVRFGLREHVPVALDIRDFWPDVFLSIVPQALRPLARVPLQPLFRATREACAGATAILGISPEFVEWGLLNGARDATPLDRDFPHGYVQDEPAAAELVAAREAWRARGVEQTGFNACFFGTIGRQFDLETVIRAARMLEHECPEVKFVICGEGDRLPRYRTMGADLTNVVFPGWVSFAEIWQLMRMSAIGLAPYVGDANFAKSIGNKPIEYLSAGLPIVSSLRGVLEELLIRYNCGRTYAEGNADELARIIHRLYADRRELHAMSACASELYRERFIAQSVYGQLAEHLERIVRDYRHRRDEP